MHQSAAVLTASNVLGTEPRIAAWFRRLSRPRIAYTVLAGAAFGYSAVAYLTGFHAFQGFEYVFIR